MLNLKPQVFQAEVRTLIDVAEEEKISRRLDYIYSQTPMNNCQRCANCCFNSPQVHHLEFLNIYCNLKTLPELIQVRLGRKLIEYELLNLTTLKNKCSFLEEEGCLIYSHRPLQCRLFGLYPKDEYEKIVTDCRRENEKLAVYYSRSKCLPLPGIVMTYDIDQCENNIDASGNIIVMTANERIRMNTQIRLLSEQILPSSWLAPGLISFSNRYALLFVDDAQLEDIKVRAIREYQKNGNSPTLNHFLDKYDFRFQSFSN